MWSLLVSYMQKTDFYPLEPQLGSTLPSERRWNFTTSSAWYLDDIYKFSACLQFSPFQDLYYLDFKCNLFSISLQKGTEFFRLKFKFRNASDSSFSNHSPRKDKLFRICKRVRLQAYFQCTMCVKLGWIWYICAPLSPTYAVVDSLKFAMNDLLRVSG
mgnify:CR=1 FL=1